MSKLNIFCNKLQPDTEEGREVPSAFQKDKALTSGKRCTSAMNLVSKGEELSFLQTRASGSGTFRSTTDIIATLVGHRKRAVPSTHPTPKPFATRLRIVASFGPS